jgi:NAD(P)H-binding
MYGSDYAKNGVDKEGHAKPISAGEDIGAALQDATSMILVGHDNPVEVSTLETFLKYMDKEKIRKVVLLSKMGVKNSSGGFFGGGGNKALQQSEEGLAKLARDNNLDFSIVRAGILKGGGPGIDEAGDIIHSFGLDRAYYNTILDVVEFKVAMAHDKFTLGASSTSVVAGDPHSMPNMMSQMGTKTSFDPSPTDTNRIVAASAAVAALDIGPLEISVGSAEGRSAPTAQQWTTLLQSLQPKVLG